MESEQLPFDGPMIPFMDERPILSAVAAPVNPFIRYGPTDRTIDKMYILEFSGDPGG
jgi:hypothetical protein